MANKCLIYVKNNNNNTVVYTFSTVNKHDKQTSYYYEKLASREKENKYTKFTKYRQIQKQKISLEKYIYPIKDILIYMNTNIYRRKKKK